ncbi:MAG: TrkH family potassium uptake protein [Catonella sp.]|uniref:TrkH family potassium uptake protein n=1 Tax=Catonella sp. TaxID=2382125 RepID=UPI003FA01996
MNYLIIAYIMGWVLNFEGAFLLLPAVTALIYGEKEGYAFLACSVLSFIIGGLVTLKKPTNKRFYAREGFVICSLTWIVISLVGAIPFVLTGVLPNYIDALFEIVSGFTTTGSSVITDLTPVPHCVLIWRSFSHWIGGMGVLVFILAILPLFGGVDMHLMRAESPGPSVGKLVPNVKKTASYLYKIYLGMTVVQFIILLCTGMNPFDAVCITFGTAGTGGFGIHNDSCGGYTILQQAVITVFMLLFGINFNVYFLMIKKKIKEVIKIEEVKWYLIIVFTAVALIVINLGEWDNIYLSIHYAFFSVASVITTTGYATADFNLWPMFAKTVLLMIMFVGACAGSTGGGMKVSRILIYAKTVKKEIVGMIHQKSIKILKMDCKTVEHSVIRNANVYLVSYILIMAFSLLIISLDNIDFESSFTAVVATFNNIGPGLNKVGPTGNFSEFSNLSKLVFIFDMLAGRLEIFPMLLLFSKATWSRK